MFTDFSTPLWFLKLGALVNLYFLAATFRLPPGTPDFHVVVPAQIFFAVSAFRCLFPVSYKGDIVFHDSPLSSIFLTRLLATFSEVAYIYLFSHVIRLLNVDEVGWVNLASWLMVAQVVVSQCFVWGAIVSERLVLYFYEELGWAIIFVANTIAAAYLYVTTGSLDGREGLLLLSVLFGLVYLPWQLIHLSVLRADAEKQAEMGAAPSDPAGKRLWNGLVRSIRHRNATTDPDAWSRLVGLSWMVGYWATLIPIWLNHIVGVVGVG